MKKTIYYFTFFCLFAHQLAAQPLSDPNTLLIHFAPTTSQVRIKRMLLDFNAIELQKLPNSDIRIWRINAFPVVIGSLSLRNIIEVSEHARNNTDVSSDPNYETENEQIEHFNTPLPGCPSYPLTGCAGPNGIIVGFADSGIDGSYVPTTATFLPNPIHATLFTNRIWKNTEIYNKADDDLNGYLNDYTGWNWIANSGSNLDDHDHGTHCAGITAKITQLANTTNVKIMSLKTQDMNGKGNLVSLLKAIDYSIGKNVKIMNLSLSYFGTKAGCNKSVVKKAITIAGQKKDMLFVIAAGNQNFNLDLSTNPNTYFPAYFNNDNTIVVGASDCSGAKASFSNYGKISVDIAAPGVRILSSVRGGWAYKSGTSMSAPFVSATAALLGTKMAWNAAIIKNLILTKATNNGGNLNIPMSVTAQPWSLLLSTTGKLLNISNTLNCTLSKNTNKDESTIELEPQLSIAPNPFEEQLRLQINSTIAAKGSIMIQNAVGQVIFKQNVSCELGNNWFELELNTLPKGVFIVQALIGDSILNQKIVKQ